MLRHALVQLFVRSKLVHRLVELLPDFPDGGFSRLGTLCARLPLCNCLVPLLPQRCFESINRLQIALHDVEAVLLLLLLGLQSVNLYFACLLIGHYFYSSFLHLLYLFFEFGLLSFEFLDLLFTLCNSIIQLAQVLDAALDSGLVLDQMLLVLGDFLVELPKFLL